MTVTLLSADELGEAQIGYGVGPHGEALDGDAPGDWKRSWLVVAREGLLGDPIFVDLESDGLRVFTAMHGAGAWEPEQIALLLRASSKPCEKSSASRHGRGNPVELERNPLPDSERESR